MDSNFFGNFDEEPQIDLTPLIDCLFMLIIFFVLTMTFSRPVLEIVLPEAVHAEASGKRDEILLNVKSDGTFWLDQDRQVTLAELASELEANPQKLLNIYMDKGADFGVFVSVLDLTKDKREGRFVISTKQEDGAENAQRSSPN